MPLAYAPEVIIGIWALATIPQTIVSIAFTVVMGAAAGPRRRQYLMSRRWSVLGSTTALTVVLVGLFLDHSGIAFPLNYQILFIASFGGAMVSFLFSQRIVIPDNPPLPPEGQVRVSLRERLRDQLDVVRGSPAFGAFVISSFVFNLGLTMAMPLFPLYWVRDLQAPDTWIGLIATVNNGITMLGYFLWVAVGKRRGNVFVLRFCAFGLGFYPLLAALTPSIPPQVIYAGMAGIFGAGLNLVLFDLSLATVPQDRVPSSIALYQVTTFIATLVAPLIGTTIAGVFGYAVALMTAAALRFAGAALFVALGVGATPPATAKR